MSFKNIFFLLITAPLFVFTSCSDDDEDLCMIDTSLQTETAYVDDISATHATVYTDIIIDASSIEVWEVLTDFGSMPNWSSTFKGLEGDIFDGGSATANFDFGMGPVMFPHTLIFEEGVRFGWSDPVLGVDGMFDNHFYTVEAISDCQTRFIQTDGFQGVNDNVTPVVLANQVMPVYQLFNQELKLEVEK